MKYLAIAALVGLISAAEVESEFSRFQGRRLNTYIQQEEAQCTDSSDSSCDDDEAEDIQLRDFPAYMNGFGGYKTYIRDTPDRFETEADDTLMRSMYETYAIEGEDKNGLPTGRYWVTKDSALKSGRWQRRYTFLRPLARPSAMVTSLPRPRPRASGPYS